MLKIAFTLTLAGTALIVGLLTYNDQSWLIRLQLGDINLGINLAVLTAALIFSVLLLLLLIKLIRLPFRMHRALLGRKETQAATELNRGLMLYLEGSPKAARRPLLNAARHPAFVQGASLLAACCAIRENQLFNANESLKAARQAGCSPFVLSLVQAELLIAENKLLQARNLLEELAQTHPDNDRIAQLLEPITSANAEDA